MFSSQARFNQVFSSALLEGRVSPHFQPIVSLKDRSVVGLEVLARWYDPDHGYVSPAVFVPYAERGGMLDELLDMLMAQALLSANEWEDGLYLSFNVSPQQLHNPELPRRISSTAKETGFPASNILIEITESAILDEGAEEAAILQQIIAMGCAIVLDDFGTGYSSLTWLRTLPFSKIKIDTSFVSAMLSQKESRKIVTAVVGLGQSLDCPVIAEGVETMEQAELLRRIGCPFAQGQLFGNAVPAEQVPPLLRAAAQQMEPSPPRIQLSVDQRNHQITSIYEASAILIAFLDPDLFVADANESFAGYLNKSRTEIIGCSIVMIMPEIAPSLEALREERRLSQRAETEETLLQLDRMEFMMVIQSIYDEANDLLGYSLLGFDRAERGGALNDH